MWTIIVFDTFGESVGSYDGVCIRPTERIAASC